MQNLIHHSNLIPGLIDNSVEFFALSRTDIRASHKGMILMFEQFPKWVIDKVKADMPRGVHTEDAIKGHIFNHYGALDCIPDIDANGNLNKTEYLDGSALKTLPVGNGEELTEREIDVLRLIYLSSEEIAEKLFISPKTVKRHTQNIKAKLDLTKSTELAVWATKRGLIK